MKLEKSGAFGVSASAIGVVLLLVTFGLAYLFLLHYEGAIAPSDLTTSMGTLLYAAIQALFLGIMGWVGSLLLLRGIEFLKVDRGVGVVTFKVEKGVGIVTNTQEEKGAESKVP